MEYQATLVTKGDRAEGALGSVWKPVIGAFSRLSGVVQDIALTPRRTRPPVGRRSAAAHSSFQLINEMIDHLQWPNDSSTNGCDNPRVCPCLPSLNVCTNGRVLESTAETNVRREGWELNRSAFGSTTDQLLLRERGFLSTSDAESTFLHMLTRHISLPGKR